jgi:hypothetical protein
MLVVVHRLINTRIGVTKIYIYREREREGPTGPVISSSKKLLLHQQSTVRPERCRAVD